MEYGSFDPSVIRNSNNHMHSDSKKRRSFLALLFAAGDVKRWAAPAIRGKPVDDEPRRVKVEGLPTTQNGGLRVELVPMPGSDNPWRTRADYQEEQRRDSARFWVTIVSLVVAIVGVAGASAVAIHSVPQAGAQAKATVLSETPPLAMSPLAFSAVVPLLLALQFAAFGWRINREIAVSDEGRQSWLPIPDIINVLSMFSVVMFCILLPLRTGSFTQASITCIAAASVLIAFHPVSMAGHYRLFSPLGRSVYSQRGRDYPYVTDQEIVSVVLSLLCAGLAGWYVT